MSSNIDHLFKKALQDRSCEPPPHIWDRIETQLYARKKRRVLAWWLSSAAVIALLFSLSGLLPLKKEGLRKDLFQQIVKETIPNNKITPEKETKKPEIVATVTPPISNPEENVKSVAYNNKVSLMPIEIRNGIENGVIGVPLPGINLQAPTIRRDLIPLTSKEAIENNQLYHKLLALNTVPDQTLKKKIKLSLSGHVAPGYSSGIDKSPVNKVRSHNYTSNQMSGIFNLSGGLKLSMEASKRWSVQAGVFYSRLGQRTEENNVYIPRENLLAVSGGNSINTPWGRVKNKAKAVVYKTDKITALSNEKVNNGSIEQFLGALEIPLAVKYRLNDNKIRFSLLGGISGSFIVDNRAYLKYNNKRESMGSTEDIRNFNVSTDLGIGIEYPLTSKIRFMVEPGFKYYLQSVSRNEAINFKPYAFSFSTGIGIDF